MNPIEQLFCEQLFRIHRRQMRYFGQLPRGAYAFHRDTGTVVFPDGTVFETQVLGLETPEKQWVWAWADSDVLDPRLKVAAERVKAHGELHGLPELTTGTLDVSPLACAGHTLAAIATVLHAVHPYMRCEQPDGVAVYVLVTSVTLEDDSRDLPRDDVRRAISAMFEAYAQRDDMLTLRCAMEAAGFTVESTDTEIIGRRADDQPMVFQRAWFG